MAKSESGLGNGFRDMGAIGHVQFVSRLMHMTSALISTAFGEEVRKRKQKQKKKIILGRTSDILYILYNTTKK